MGAQKGWFEELGCLTVHMFRNTWFGVCGTLLLTNKGSMCKACFNHPLSLPVCFLIIARFGRALPIAKGILLKFTYSKQVNSPFGFGRAMLS